MKVTRRAFLELTALGLAATALPRCSSPSMPAACTPPFLTGEERSALAVLADQVLPADATPGASGLGAVDYIEGLLSAMECDPPRIFAGGPYSGRQPFAAQSGGVPGTDHPPDDFAQSVPLSRVSTAAWRLRLYGSSGVPGSGVNDAVLGPVVGLRDQIRQGLAMAMQLAPPGESLDKLDPNALSALWAKLPADFKNALVPLVLEGVFSAPEYGGNKDLGGWALAHYAGDSQPLGYSLFDPATGAYRERPDAPMSTADPGTDPDPLDDDTKLALSILVLGLKGRVA